MRSVNDILSLAYEIDQSTIDLMGLFCLVACYLAKPRVQNVLVLLLLFPAFLAASCAAYATATYCNAFNPQRTTEWLIYATVSAAIGSSAGIALVSLLRGIHDKFTVAANKRRIIRRMEEGHVRGFTLKRG